MDTMYEKDAPLGGDVCTGGPAQRAWTFGMYMSDAYRSVTLDAAMQYNLHATQGCAIDAGPLDAPCDMPAGSTKMDWFQRSTFCKREHLPLHVNHDKEYD